MRILLSIILLFFSLCMHAQEESEPNNETSTSNLLNFEDDLKVDIKGFIDPKGDKDFYKISIPRSGVINARVVPPDNLGMSVRLINSDLQEIAVDRDGNHGNTISIDKLVCASGEREFYLELAFQGNNWSAGRSSSPYNLFITFDTTDVYECNNSINSATPIELGQVSGTIRSKGDKDFYKISIPRSGVINARVVPPSNLGMSVKLINSDLQEIAVDADGNHGNTIVIDQLVCANGETEFYLELAFQGNNWSVGASPFTYTLFTSFDTTDVYECNNSVNSATPIELGQVSGTIRSKGDKDYYKISLPRSGIVNARVVPPSNIGMSVKLIDSDLNELSRVWNGNEGVEIILDQLVCGAGDYYLELAFEGNNWSAGVSSSPYNLFTAFDTTDLHECNNSVNSATPIELGQITGTIRSKGDKDFYKISLPRAGILNTRLVPPNNLGMSVKLIDSDLNKLFRVWNGNVGTVLNMDKLICTAGDYYLELAFEGNNWSAGVSFSPYNLFISLDTTDRYECNQDFGSASIVNVCDTIIGAIWTKDDVDYYRVLLDTGTVEIQIGDIPEDLTLNLKMFDLSQQELPNFNSFGTSRQPLSAIGNIDKLGEYYIKITDSNSKANPNKYKMQVFQHCILSSAKNEFDIASVRIFPNPVSNKLYIEILSNNAIDKSKIHYEIFSLAGKLIAANKLSDFEINIDGNLPVGLYFLRLTHKKDVIFYSKFAKE